MNKQYKLAILMGKAGSGKDWLLRQIIERDTNHEFQKVVNCTTRPIREHEQDGVNYHFLTVEDFTEKVVNGDMIEATEFNHWFYGTMLSTLSPDKINIGVFNPTAVEILLEDKRLNTYVVYVEAPDKVRLLRQLNREEYPDCHEIVRRFTADEQDFNDERIIGGIEPAIGVYNDGEADIQAILALLIPHMKHALSRPDNFD